MQAAGSCVGDFLREREKERERQRVDLPSPLGDARGRPGEVAVESSGLAGWTLL